MFPLYAPGIGRGMRMGELCRLQWCDVDLDRKVVVVRRNYARDFPKDKEPRYVPIDAALAKILKQWRAVCPSKEHVFPFEDGSPRLYPKPPRGFADHLKRAGCPRVRFHDLRHHADVPIMPIRPRARALAHEAVPPVRAFPRVGVVGIIR